MKRHEGEPIQLKSTELQIAGALSTAALAKQNLLAGEDNPEVDGHLARQISHTNALTNLMTILANEKGAIDTLNGVLEREGEVVVLENKP